MFIKNNFLLKNTKEEKNKIIFYYYFEYIILNILNYYLHEQHQIILEGSTNFFSARISEHSDGGLSGPLVYIWGSIGNGAPCKDSFITLFPVASIVAFFSEYPVLREIIINYIV